MNYHHGWVPYGEDAYSPSFVPVSPMNARQRSSAWIPPPRVFISAGTNQGQSSSPADPLWTGGPGVDAKYIGVPLSKGMLAPQIGSGKHKTPVESSPTPSTQGPESVSASHPTPHGGHAVRDSDLGEPDDSVGSHSLDPPALVNSPMDSSCEPDIHRPYEDADATPDPSESDVFHPAKDDTPLLNKEACVSRGLSPLECYDIRPGGGHCSIRSTQSAGPPQPASWDFFATAQVSARSVSTALPLMYSEGLNSHRLAEAIASPRRLVGGMTSTHHHPHPQQQPLPRTGAYRSTTTINRVQAATVEPRHATLQDTSIATLQHTSTAPSAAAVAAVPVYTGAESLTDSEARVELILEKLEQLEQKLLDKLDHLEAKVDRFSAVLARFDEAIAPLSNHGP